MKRKRKQYSPEEKVAIIRRHLVENEPVSDLCDRYGLHPTVYYRWQKDFFDHGAEAFRKKKDAKERQLKKKVEKLEARLARKHEVLSELMEEHVALKKNLGEA